MDPFSLTLSVASVVALVGQALGLAKDFYSGAKNARESATMLVIELQSLQSNLSRLDKFIRNESTKGHVFNQTSILISISSTIHSKLTTLCSKLNLVRESKTKRLLWPFNEEDHLKTIQTLRAFTQIIQFSLSIDGCTILSKTSDDVVKVLQQQINTIKSLQSLEDHNAELLEAVMDQTNILQQNQDIKLREEVLNWISKLDYNRKHHSVRLPRIDGTGSWLLENPLYLKWRDEEYNSNILWCHGIQGSGKSILTSLVIDQLKSSYNNPNYPLAFVYFDYRDQNDQSPTQILASILKQVINAIPTIPGPIMDFYDKSKGSEHQISHQDLEKLIILVVESIRGMYLVIDALDECDEQKYRKVFLQILKRFKSNNQIRLFITSRSYPEDIRTILGDDPKIEIKAHDTDLQLYLQHELQDICDSGIINHSFAMEIVDRLINRAQGLFLLAVLQLRTVLNEPTAGDMEDALQNLSKNLPDAFEETITRIQRLPQGRSRLGLKALSWICHSTRLITINELIEALSVKPGQSVPNPKYRPSPKLVIECCQGLINIESESMIVRPAHYSIQEYLIRQSNTIFPEAQAEIATTCLTYLMFDIFKTGPCHDEQSLSIRLKEYPLLFYAAHSGCIHAKNSTANSIVKDITTNFLNSQGAISSANQALRYGLNYREEYWELEESLSVSPIHMAAYFDLRDTLWEYLDSKTVPIDIKSKMGITALIKASSKGHTEMVKMLLEKGANPYIENWYGNALHCAAEAGECGTILELIKYGVDPNIRGSFGRTPLHCTADNGHAEAANTLITNGADVNARDWDGLTAFHYADSSNSLDLVELLLKFGVDVNI